MYSFKTYETLPGWAGAGLPAWISPDIIDLQGPTPLISIIAAGADEVRRGCPGSSVFPGGGLSCILMIITLWGGRRGGIDERWLSSATPADNGPETGENEGLSFGVYEEGGRAERFLLRDAVEELKGDLIGDRIWGGVREMADVLQVFR